MNLRSRVAVALLLALPIQNGMAERLIGEGDQWRYYKGSSTPPLQAALNWTELAYDDSGWGPASPSGFGYGDSDDATQFNDMQNSYASVFLRKTFVVADPSAITRLTLAVDYDDGFVAYLNGVEIARRNMPVGVITHATPASGTHEASRGNGSSNPQEKEFGEIDPSLLVVGSNVLAVSGHNVSLGSSDFTLVPELYSNVTLVRGPFLQMPTPGAISVIWRTDALTDSAVDYGADTNYLGGTITDSTLLRQHIITLPTLPPGTNMYYRVRSGGVTLAESIFKTPRASNQPFRFALYGDFGWSEPQTAGVATRVNTADPDLTLTVGDNIYQDGQPGSYDSFWFMPYDAVNRRAPLFPALGNHDVDNSSNGQYYIDNFYLPQNGPAGLQERNYSFDYANAHFAIVDSNPFVHKIDAAAQPAIKNWLAADLAASGQRWKFVVFHHPAYTSSGPGVHSPYTTMQTEISSICEQHGVQIIFQGHNHFYERINPINGVNYIMTGAGGRALVQPNFFPTYSAALNDSVYSFALVDVSGGLLTLQQIDTSGNVIDSFAINLDSGFEIDGLLDSPDYLRAQNGLKLYAAIRGNTLYVATQDAGEGSDHFIYLNTQSAVLRPANWSKAGQVMQWGAFLADENESGFKGWFDSSEQVLSNSTLYSATTSGLNNNGATGNGVLEGTLNLPGHFGSFPSQLYLAAAPFGTANGGALVASEQVPAGNSDGDIQVAEFLVLNTRDIALDLPISNAGPNQSVEAGMMVTLPGTGSSAPSGLSITFAWTQLSGLGVTINNADEIEANFSSGNVGVSTDLIFRLRVNDTRFDTDDMVTIQLFPMVDSDSDGLSDQEELTGNNNSLTSADPAGETTNPNVADTDGDGMNDGDEALSGTNPNNAASALRAASLTHDGATVGLSWASVPGRVYQLQRRTELTLGDWEDLGTPITANAFVTPASDVNPPPVKGFYRVRLIP